MRPQRFAGLFVVAIALLAPACASTRAYPDRPRYEPVSAYDLGYRNGLRDGQWAGYRDAGKPMRHDFWRDGKYRQATEGYRAYMGPRAVYSDGYRAGYERGYKDRRSREYRRRS